MIHIKWADGGASKQILAAIQSDADFEVVFGGDTGAAIAANLGVTARFLSPEEIVSLVAVLAILAFTGLALYAMSKEYEVETSFTKDPLEFRCKLSRQQRG